MVTHPAFADLFVLLAGAMLSPFVPSADEAAGWWTFQGLAYHEQIRIAREKGEPVTLEEMNAFYPTSPEIEAATKHWLAAMDWNAAIDAARGFQDEAVPALPFIDSKVRLEANEGLTEEQVQAAEAYLDQRERAFEEVRLARDAGAVARYPVEFEKSLWADRDYLQGLRGLANDLRLSLELHLAQDDTAGAVDDALSLLALSESLRNEPMIVSQLVRQAIVHVAWNATAAVIERGRPSAADLLELQRAWQETEFLESSRRTLIGERYILERLTIDPPPEAGKDATVMRNRWSKRIDAGASMAMFRRAIDGSEGNFRRARNAYGKFEVMLEDFLGRTPQPVLLLYLNTALQLPAVQAAFHSASRAQVHASLAEASLACERFRRAEGRWPRELAELVPKYLPEIPVDAFGEDRLSYRLEGAGAIVYSFGENRRDDGGKDHVPYRHNSEMIDYRSNDMIYRLVPRPTE